MYALHISALKCIVVKCCQFFSSANDTHLCSQGCLQNCKNQVFYSVIKPPEWQLFGPVCIKKKLQKVQQSLNIYLLSLTVHAHTHKPIPHPALSPPFNGLIFNIPLLQQGHGNTRGTHYHYPEGSLASSSGYRGVSLLSLSGSFSE